MQRDVDVAHGTWARIGRKEDKFRPASNTTRLSESNNSILGSLVTKTSPSPPPPFSSPSSNHPPCLPRALRRQRPARRRRRGPEVVEPVRLLVERAQSGRRQDRAHIELARVRIQERHQVRRRHPARPHRVRLHHVPRVHERRRGRHPERPLRLRGKRLRLRRLGLGRGLRLRGRVEVVEERVRGLEVLGAAVVERRVARAGWRARVRRRLFAHRADPRRAVARRRAPVLLPRRGLEGDLGDCTSCVSTDTRTGGREERGGVYSLLQNSSIRSPDRWPQM